MKRYLTFAGDRDCILGGWGDFKFADDNVSECVNTADKAGYDWLQVVDRLTGTVMYVTAYRGDEPPNETELNEIRDCDKCDLCEDHHE